MMEADNTFNGIFGNTPSTPIMPTSVEKPVEAPATEDLAATVAPLDTDKQSISEELEPNATEQPVRRRGRRRKDDGSTDGATADKVGHFSCICDKDLIAKVRAIAWQEHMTVRAVVEGMFSKSIAKYEKKRGPIQIEPNHSPEELF